MYREWGMLCHNNENGNADELCSLKGFSLRPTRISQLTFTYIMCVSIYFYQIIPV